MDMRYFGAGPSHGRVGDASREVRAASRLMLPKPTGPSSLADHGYSAWMLSR